GRSTPPSSTIVAHLEASSGTMTAARDRPTVTGWRTLRWDDGVMDAIEQELRIVDNPDQGRYEAVLGDDLAGIVTYRRRPGHVVFLHTEVLPAFEGRGIGSRLAAGVLDDARARGLAVIPRCPFIAAYIRRHPEYGGLAPVPPARARPAASASHNGTPELDPPEGEGEGDAVDSPGEADVPAPASTSAKSPNSETTVRNVPPTPAGDVWSGCQDPPRNRSIVASTTSSGPRRTTLTRADSGAVSGVPSLPATVIR